MKNYILLVLLSLYNSGALLHAQTIRGTVQDAESGAPLAYVHIGVMQKNVGVISRENGTFEINLQNVSPNASLTFSMIGYAQKSFPIRDLKGKLNVQLEPQSFNLKEIVIRDEKIQQVEKFGRFSPTKTTRGQSGTKKFGHGGEIGLKVFHEGKTYQVRDVNMHLRFNTMDSILFRVNIYRVKDGLPGESLLQRQIFAKVYKRKKWVTKNLLEENIIIDEDVFVSFELVRIWYSKVGGNNFFYTYGDGYEKGRSYSRDSSLDAWKVDAWPPLTIYINGILLNE